MKLRCVWQLRANILLLAVLVTSVGCGNPIIAPSPSDQRLSEHLIDQGTFYLRQGDFKQSEASFQMAYDLQPHAAALDGLGCVAAWRGDFATAERYFLSALAMEPAYVEALSNLAYVKDRRGERDEARVLYEKAIALEPQNSMARNNQGAMLAEEGQRSSAEASFRAANIINANPIVERNLGHLATVD